MHDSDSFELKQLEFPKEFERKLSHLIDKRYSSILIASMLFHVMLVLYFLMNPLSHEKSLSKIAKVQKRLAQTIKSNEINLNERLAKLEFIRAQSFSEKEESAPDKIKKSKPAGSAKKIASKLKRSKVASSSTKRGRGGGRRAASKAEIEATVGSKGILGLLTSTSSRASGREVQDILGNASQTQTDLDEALSGLTGIKTQVRPGGGSGVGAGGGGVKGGRNQGAESIEGLVSGLGKTKSSSFTRSGDLVVVSESPLIEKSDSRGIIGRDQDAVQAVVTRHNNSIQYCYERELKRNPNLKGKIVLRFVITPSGTVKNVEMLSSTLNNRKVHQCIISRVRRWTDFGVINSSYGDTTIRQVYTFGY